MGLTAHQKVKMQELIALIKAGHKRITLTAFAGAGKTFMMQELIKILKTELYQYGAVYVTAPTHKALNVLKTKIEAKPYIKFSTIHSAHQLIQRTDFKTGRKFFIQKQESDKYPRFKAAQVVIIDESTMLEEALLNYNEQHPNILFIFIGDPPYERDGHKHPGQLPPVGEKRSPVFFMDYPNVRLEEPVRQKEGSPILTLSHNLKLIKSKIDSVNDTGGYVFERDRNYIIQKLAEVNGTDEVKYVAYTNAEVDLMNSEVRRKIYGDPAKVEIGESIIFTAPYGTLFKNRQEIKILSVDKVRSTLIVPDERTMFKLDENGVLVIEETMGENNTPIPSYEIRDTDCLILNGQIRIIDRSEEEWFNNKVKELKALVKAGLIAAPATDWFIDKFAKFAYNHAITCHSAQGSTFQTTIINIGNIEFNRRRNPDETESMLYTAVTRAAKMVVLYNVR